MAHSYNPNYLKSLSQNENGWEYSSLPSSKNKIEKLEQTLKAKLVDGIIKVGTRRCRRWEREQLGGTLTQLESEFPQRCHPGQPCRSRHSENQLMTHDIRISLEGCS